MPHRTTHTQIGKMKIQQIESKDKLEQIEDLGNVYEKADIDQRRAIKTNRKHRTHRTH